MMTVGDTTGDGRGYQSLGSQAGGSLVDDDFTVPGDNDYEVVNLRVDTNHITAAELTLSATLTNKDDYILEWAGVELPLELTTGAFGRTLYWDTSWLAMNAPALDADTFETTLPDGGMVQV